MSQRRLFSPDIVESDAFLEMPLSSQVLYFHLAMHADDDGFVNPRTVMRILGTPVDDLRVLLAKRFLLEFENGVVVIKHWLIHNTIRKDRYKPTRYLEQKSCLKIKENGSYTESGNQMATIGQPNGDILVTQVKLSKAKSSKVKISSTNVEEQSSEVVFGNEDINWVLNTFKDVMGFESSGRGQQDRFMAKHLLGKFNKTQIQGMMRYCATDEFAPRVGSVEKLWQKRGDIVAGIKSLQNKTKGTIQSI